MSTKEQLQGGSLERQYDKTEKYVKGRNLDLVKNYDDIGVSGFHARNEQKEFGLGQFLDALKEGLVEPGSYLIIESMDRLTRQPPMKAMSMFNEIISRGVIVVTLDDGMEYSTEGFLENQYKLFMALGSMMRAHGESARKSDLQSAAWNQKRSRLISDGTVLTTTVPAWLRANKTKNSIDPIPERVLIIKEIFDLTCNGYGIYSIARLLNQRGEPAWGVPRRTKGHGPNKKPPIWRDSYIKKILVNRAVLGEFQPHRSKVLPNRKTVRIPVGDVIQGYYPQVVSKEVFADANLAMERRRTNAKGRKGAAYSNLFTGMLRCESCGSGMRYLDKGGKTKDSKYLKCSVAVSGGGCDPKSYRYDPVEQVILSSLEYLDVEKVLSGEAISARLREKKSRREGAASALEQIEKKIDNVNNKLASDDGPIPKNTLAMLRSFEEDQDKLRSTISLLDAEIEDLLVIDPKRRKAVLDELMIAIKDEDASKKARSRRALAAELQRMIDTLVLRRDIEATYLRDPSESSWSDELPHLNSAQIQQYLKDFGFEVSVRYRNGEQDIIRGLNLHRMKLKSNKRFTRMKAIAKFESDY